MDYMRIALKFAYNGKYYHGFARQPDVKTIEGNIIHLLIKSKIVNNIKDANFRYASRTDKGVSAFANIISFNTKEDDNILQELNDISDDIIFYGKKYVNSNFNPRYAIQRIYRYHYKINKIELSEVNKIIDLFKGEHDFSNFARIESPKNSIKIIDDITIRERENFLIIDFFAQSFLWHQIRKIISGLDKVINYKISKENLKYALRNPNIKVDYGLAPPEPLVLMNIIYDFEFDYYKKAIDKLIDFKKSITDNIKYQYF
jgi:tRNA pseudouridine38-40 synthase